MPRYLLILFSPEHYHSLIKNPPFWRIEVILVWSTIDSSLESLEYNRFFLGICSNCAVVDIGVLQDSLLDGLLQVDRRLFNEG